MRFQTQNSTALPCICWRVFSFKIFWVTHDPILSSISMKLKSTNTSFVQIISEIQNHKARCMKISCGLMKKKKRVQVIFLTHGSENKCILCTPRTHHNNYFYLWNCRNKWQFKNVVAHFKSKSNRLGIVFLDLRGFVQVCLFAGFLL